MPLSLTIVPNPDFRPETKEETEQFEAVKARGPVTMFSIKAREALRHPRSMFIPAPVGPDRTVEHRFNVDLKSMTNPELVTFAANMGITVQKAGMKKALLIELIEKRIAERAASIGDDDE